MAPNNRYWRDPLEVQILRVETTNHRYICRLAFLTDSHEQKSATHDPGWLGHRQEP
jgi:hypothetical protein